MFQQQETCLPSPLQATDHTFLQKCHYHHGNSPWYTKPKLPLPVFTVKHYAGPVTYQVSWQGALSSWSNRPAWKHAVDVLTDQLQLSNIFDVEYVTCQLRHSGILEAIHIRKEGYPVRLPFQNFLGRYSGVLGIPQPLKEREVCAAVLSHVVGSPSDLYQIGVTKVMPIENPILIAQAQPSVCWLSTDREQLGSLPKEGKHCMKRYRRLKKTLMQFNTMILISRPLIQRRKHCQPGDWYRCSGKVRCMLAMCYTVNRMCSGSISNSYNARLLSLTGQYREQANQITEALPPEVKVKDNLSLPPNINSYPFSSFIKSQFQKTYFPAPGQPLQHPLTHLDAEYQESALEINKLILRFIGDKNLHGWQEVLLGNYIAGRGLNNVALRNEIFSQVVAQTWKNPDMEHSQRAWVLMATLLSCFAPSPALEKPLLKFVSDHGMEGYNAVCQRKILTAAQHTEIDSTFSRAYPPTQLEWTANQRRGKMVLDVHTFNEEKFSAEVESWMTGEQYAGWLLSARGCDKKSRGWSISMFTGNAWQDLLGCDFVLDLIGEMEESGRPYVSLWFPFSTSVLLCPAVCEEINHSRIPVAGACGENQGHPAYVMCSVGLIRASSSAIPQKHCEYGLLPLGFSGMTQASAYQPMPSMIGMPAAMPMMPVSAMAMPQPVVPAVDPNQLAAQQQAFINQQAMLMSNALLSSPIAPASPLPPPEPKPKKQTPKSKKEPPVVKPSGPDLRPAPSREIRNIIKMYQSRPAPEPQPIEPIRVSKPFIKKNDPKNEALAKLGMMNLPSSKSVSSSLSPSPLPQEKRPPPPPKPKPGSASSSIKEKQLPLLSVFSQESTPPGSQTPPASPPPPSLSSSLLPGTQDWQESTGKTEDDGIKTQLYKLTTSVSFSYVNPAWKIFLRKEVFYPKENFSHPYCLNLLCEQIMRDTFSDSCFRISKEEKRKMKDLLMEFQVGNDIQSIQEDGIKKRIVLAARDNWANYFSRLFPVHGENGSDVQILGVSHRGMRLLKVVKAAGYNPEHLKILCSYSFADVLSVELKGSSALEFSLKTEQLFLHSPKRCSDTNYVVALRSYIADDKSLLSFKKGDLIELLPMQGVEPGWQFGSTGGRCGIFPTSLVQLAAAPDYLSTSMDRSHQGEPSLSPWLQPESQLQPCL
uniref:Unconventional myosin-XVB n=1 Tax=Buteo japonicus TaxID=224669 RepID=A0A8C0HNF6_9AVES